MNIHIPLGSAKVTYPNNKVIVEKICNGSAVCIGSDEASQHPKVFLALKNGNGKCHYCGTIFKQNT
ncbi:MAG: putative Zn-finger protein [Candidatus Deianiraeaceae bacterium]|jgi:uncharacterized Zn-finger protein